MYNSSINQACLKLYSRQHDQLVTQQAMPISTLLHHQGQAGHQGEAVDVLFGLQSEALQIVSHPNQVRHWFHLDAWLTALSGLTQIERSVNWPATLSRRGRCLQPCLRSETHPATAWSSWGTMWGNWTPFTSPGKNYWFS